MSLYRRLRVTPKGTGDKAARRNADFLVKVRCNHSEQSVTFSLIRQRNLTLTPATSRTNSGGLVTEGTG